jgi:hypothetical protein
MEVKPITNPYLRRYVGDETILDLQGERMTEELTLQRKLANITGYFSQQDWIIIVLLAIIAFLTSSYGLNYILPGGPGGGFAHGFLKMPGPGAGIFITSAFICLWLVLGLLLTRKPGTAIAVSILITVIVLVAGLIMKGLAAIQSPERSEYSFPLEAQTLLVLVAIIIDGSGLLPLEKKPWQNIFPPVIGIMGAITLALWLTGNAKMGENGAASTVFPLGYVVLGILGLAIAVICYFYPMKYVVGAGFAEVFYIVFCWLFNGKTGFATWLPVTPAIPPLLTFALVSGAFMALLAYGVNLLWNTYAGHGATKV